MKNVHLLPTDKPSRLSILNSGKLNFGAEIMSSSNSKLQHIYITSNEDIKDGDWSFNEYQKNILRFSAGVGIGLCKKIILTTDPTLILYGVQPIEDYFLEWFVKNPSCEFVEVGYGWIRLTETNNEGYWISIPDNKLELKIEELKHPKVFSENGNELFFDEQGNLIREQLDYTALLQPVGTRQETIEETYLNQLIDEANKEFTLDRKLAKDVAVKYANWQSERMYSKEEVIAIVEKSRETGLTAEYLLLTDQFKKK
jgi:hypothetical protein